MPVVKWISGATFVTVQVLSTEASLGQTIQGSGVSTCAEYAAVARSETPRGVVIYENWVLGYLSGANVMLSVLNPNQDLLGSVRPAQVTERLKTVCLEGANGQRQIADVAIAILRALQTGAKGPK